MLDPQYTPIFSGSPSLSQLSQTSTLLPFAEISRDFIAEFSTTLASTPAARSSRELMALAYWMRPAHLERWRHEYVPAKRIFLPRGTVFQIAPSNVDTIFVYSWFLSLLCGNRNIIRVSSKETLAGETVLGVMAELFRQERFRALLDRSLVVRYGHDAELNQAFSSSCDLRVIWGGDDTINTLRRAVLPPTSTEVTFADKFSLAVLSEAAVEQASEELLMKWVEDFYNDSMWFGQMACSSPRLVLWLQDVGSDAAEVRARWWHAFDELARRKGLTWETADYINKRVMVDVLAMHVPVTIASSTDNLITRLWLDEPKIYDQWHCGTGMFHEGEIKSLNDLAPLVCRKVQTIVYAGVARDAWATFLQENSVAGIDRIVPLGQGLDFHPVWDGHDLSRVFMREVNVG